MNLQKNDPIYYKIKLNELIKQAEDEGLLVLAKDIDSGCGIQIQFKSKITCEMTAVNLLKS